MRECQEKNNSKPVRIFSPGKILRADRSKVLDKTKE
jgi:hypothetical protein